MSGTTFLLVLFAGGAIAALINMHVEAAKEPSYLYPDRRILKRGAGWRAVRKALINLFGWTFVVYVYGIFAVGIVCGIWFYIVLPFCLWTWDYLLIPLLS